MCVKCWTFASFSGGSGEYAGQDRIEPGAFTDRTPGPPGGKHASRREAEVEHADGDELAEAEAEGKRECTE